VGPARNRRQSSPRPDRQPVPADGQVPLIGRIFPAPVAAKVPEVIFLFWVVKILTTAGGEATSDYLRIYGNIRGGATEVGLFVVGLVLQFGTRRYRAFAYWFLAYAIAIFGTGVSDFLHLDVGIPYAGTTLLWAVILAAIFFLWQRSEGTLSIHSITTQRREAFYWATVFATFALGTALGDFTATSLHLGLPGLGHPLRRRHPAPGPGVVAVRPEQHRRLLDVLRRHATARCVLRRLHQQAPQPQRDQLRRRPDRIVCSPSRSFVLVSYLAIASRPATSSWPTTRVPSIMFGQSTSSRRAANAASISLSLNAA
jgi:hypothetical protein